MTFNKKAKKSIRPRASTGSTHHGMRSVSDKLLSHTKMQIFFLKNNLQPVYQLILIIVLLNLC